MTLEKVIFHIKKEDITASLLTCKSESVAFNETHYRQSSHQVLKTLTGTVLFKRIDESGANIVRYTNGEIDNEYIVSNGRQAGGWPASCSICHGIVLDDVDIWGDPIDPVDPCVTDPCLCNPCGGGGSTGGDNDDGGGNTGSDYVSVAQFLTAVAQFGYLNNPYDGMQAFDDEGVIYTYSAEFDVWLMPELVNIDGSEMFELNVPTPVNESAMVMTLTPIALIEPTFVGELVLAGTAAVVGIIYIYELSEFVENTSADREHCIDMFTICTTRLAYKNLDCSTCIQYCNAQGFWDFDRCPLNP